VDGFWMFLPRVAAGGGTPMPTVIGTQRLT
jgi:hypothetical protein